MDFDYFLKKFESFPEYTYELGVIAGESQNNRWDDVVNEINKQDDEKRAPADVLPTTNASILLRLNNGSVNIPRRPVIEMTFAWAMDKLIYVWSEKALDKYIASNGDEKVIDLYMEQNAERIRQHAYDLIVDNTRGVMFEGVSQFVPNKESTIRAKKGQDHPLFDTGQLSRSIACVMTKGV